MSVLKTVALSRIDPNPLRMLDKYPYVERKIDALLRSIKAAGFWEGVIGREVGDRIQLAFGHHRIEAARRAGLTEVRMIIRDLSDEEMVRFMGSENMEEYSADTLVLLAAWEAAVEFRGPVPEESKPLDTATLLGWVYTDKGGYSHMNDTAKTCNATYSLMQGGYITRSDLEGLSLKAARTITQRAQARMEQIDKLACEKRTTPEQTQQAKRQVGRAVKRTAEDFTAGKIKQRDLTHLPR